MMVRINLLPQELRRREMTPMAVLLPALCALTLVVGAGFFWGWLHFGQLSRAESRRDDLAAVSRSKQPMLSYLDDLRDERGEYTKRADTIREIAASRTLWTRKLDQFCDLVGDDDDGQRYLIRIDDMEVDPGRSARGRRSQPTGGKMTLTGFCYNDSDPLQHFNFFHERIKQSPFFIGDFVAVNRPEGEEKETNRNRGPQLKPSRSWAFTLELDMAPKDKPDGKNRRGRVRAAAGN